MKVREFEHSRRVRLREKPQPVSALGFAKRRRLQAAGPEAWWETVTHFVPKPWHPAHDTNGPSVLKN